MAHNVTPLPSIGEVFTGRDAAGRTLRVSAHPESDRTVLSIWQDGRCVATVRFAPADVPELIRALADGLVAQAPVPATGSATIHRLPAGPGPGWRQALVQASDRTRRLGRRLAGAVRDF